MRRKKDRYLILALLAAALLLLFIGRGSRGKTPPAASDDKNGPAAASESAPGGYADFVNGSVQAYFSDYPAESYLLVTTGGNTYSPIPLNEENAFRIAQQDGSENVIHIGKNAFYMESSNCDNQNCVGQGEVTLENRDSRMLYNMVICLPHRLTLELLTREEAEARLTGMYAQGQATAAPEG